MIMHIVLLLPREDATKEELDAAMEQVRALKEKIPGILHIYAGENRNRHNQGYTYGITIIFQDEEHLQAYFPHPAHKAISPELRRLSVNLLNFDTPMS